MHKYSNLSSQAHLNGITCKMVPEWPCSVISGISDLVFNSGGSGV